MSEPIAPVLRCEALRLGHGSGQDLAENLSLELRAGEVLALLGASGCGKSSLLRVLAGLEPPRSGSVTVLGQDLCRPHPRSALLFQRPGLLPWLSCAANVGFGLGFRQQEGLIRAERQARVSEALAAVGLADAARRYPAQLSGGMAQRAALARALARRPALLLADEPFSALDPITRLEMQQLLRHLVQDSGTATLLVTHDVDEALTVADRVLLLGCAAPDRPASFLRQWLQPAAADRGDILRALQASLPRSAGFCAELRADASAPAHTTSSSVQSLFA